MGGERDLRSATAFAQRSAHIKSDIRRIRNHKLSYRVSAEPEEFDRFYHNMYLPHTQRIFGDRALLMSYEDMRQAMPHCELFLITQEGQDIAGGILVYETSGRVRGWSLGVKDGDDRWVREGALAAFDYLQTGYLAEKGFSRLHRGGSRPFLSDGALCFKKNRGLEITDHTPHSFVVIPARNRAGVRSFLQHNPFIYQGEEKLKGAIFLSQQDAPATCARVSHDWYIRGLSCLTLFDLDASREGQFLTHVIGQIDSDGTVTLAKPTMESNP